MKPGNLGDLMGKVLLTVALVVSPRVDSIQDSLDVQDMRIDLTNYL